MGGKGQRRPGPTHSRRARLSRALAETRLLGGLPCFSARSHAAGGRGPREAAPHAAFATRRPPPSSAVPALYAGVLRRQLSMELPTSTLACGSANVSSSSMLSMGTTSGETSTMSAELLGRKAGDGPTDGTKPRLAASALSVKSASELASSSEVSFAAAGTRGAAGASAWKPPGASISLSDSSFATQFWYMPSKYMLECRSR
mmetsp:Transcript_31292/g.96215  ORF Transcript_31292/g.96215 Transcript_31292/m.96215 type:complete len:202 (-) Transcript_31292:1014-1619(-)